MSLLLFLRLVTERIVEAVSNLLLSILSSLSGFIAVFALVKPVNVLDIEGVLHDLSVERIELELVLRF